MTALPRVTMTHPTIQQARQERLEQLYRADGRHDPRHPAHGLYTGLEAAARLARWQEGCLATPLSSSDSSYKCLVRRVMAQLEAGNREAAESECNSMNIFMFSWHSRL